MQCSQIGESLFNIESNSPLDNHTLMVSILLFTVESRELGLAVHALYNFNCVSTSG